MKWDAGQVAVGQQVVLEFDAIDDFSMTGEWWQLMRLARFPRRGKLQG
jgi:hypothetical protein